MIRQGGSFLLRMWRLSDRYMANMMANVGDICIKNPIFMCVLALTGSHESLYTHS